MLAAHALGMTKGEWVFLDVEIFQVIIISERDPLIKLIDTKLRRLLFRSPANANVAECRVHTGAITTGTPGMQMIPQRGKRMNRC